MQAAQRSAWHEVRAAIRRSVTMSASASRPPGRSTRAASANTRRLSAERLITPLEITASNEPSSKGSSSIRARWKLTCSRRRRSDLASCSGVISTPMTEPAARPARGREHVHARAAAEIEHALAREQAREAEVVAHARERVHGLRRVAGRAARWGSRAPQRAGGRSGSGGRGRPRSPRRGTISAMWRSSSSGSTPPAVGCVVSCACRQRRRHAFPKPSRRLL